jgi:hypothetical protein
LASKKKRRNEVCSKNGFVELKRNARREREREMKIKIPQE